MSRTLGGVLAAITAVAATGIPAEGSWWGSTGYSYSSSYYSPSFYGSYSTAAYYYPAATPVYSYYLPTPVYAPPAMACPAPVLQPVPVVPSTPLARPTPAPPSGSQSKEPPVAQKAPKMPTVVESKSFVNGEAKPVPMLDANGKEMCRVGFWNVSGRDVMLKIDGKSYTVARDRNLTLPLGRTFTWQVDAREGRSEVVPREQASHEIVIR